jgi:hypothetical protein
VRLLVGLSSLTAVSGTTQSQVFFPLRVGGSFQLCLDLGTGVTVPVLSRARFSMAEQAAKEILPFLPGSVRFAPTDHENRRGKQQYKAERKVA